MAQKAEEHIRAMIACAAASDYQFIIYATARQLTRYYAWWGSADFEEFLKSRGEAHERAWKELGVNALAERLSKICRSEFGLRE